MGVLARLLAISITGLTGPVPAQEQQVQSPEPASGGEEHHTAIENSMSEWFADTPYINSLLFDREFPIVGGRWGLDIFVDAPLNDKPDGAKVTLRRAKLSYARRLTSDWQMKLTADYTRNGGLEPSATYVSYSGWKQTLLTVGITDPPFSLESVSASSGITFMERALPVAALSERKSGGVSLLRRTALGIINGTVMLFNVSQDDLREDGQGLVIHYARSPIERAGGHHLHLGASISYRWNASVEGTRFRSRPEIATIDDFFVDTGEIDNASQIGRLSLEASEVWGRFSWQGELMGAHVERDGQNQVQFWGAYLFASWFLTGDQRHYSLGDGSYGRVRVNKPVMEGGWGAFELAARASTVDLSDRDVVGGKERNLSIGLNWYANDQVRVMANLVKVLDLDRPGSEFDGDKPLTLSLRVQWSLK